MSSSTIQSNRTSLSPSILFADFSFAQHLLRLNRPRHLRPLNLFPTPSAMARTTKTTVDTTRWARNQAWAASVELSLKILR
jgi:hypothetical protein